jgi:hypothetical protein
MKSKALILALIILWSTKGFAFSVKVTGTIVCGQHGPSQVGCKRVVNDSLPANYVILRDSSVVEIMQVDEQKSLRFKDLNGNNIPEYTVLAYQSNDKYYVYCAKDDRYGRCLIKGRISMYETTYSKGPYQQIFYNYFVQKANGKIVRRTRKSLVSMMADYQPLAKIVHKNMSAEVLRNKLNSRGVILSFAFIAFCCALSLLLAGTVVWGFLFCAILFIPALVIFSLLMHHKVILKGLDVPSTIDLVIKEYNKQFTN